MAQRPQILVITPVRHISGVAEILQQSGDVTYLDDPTASEVAAVVAGFEAVFTNPNKSKVFLGPGVLGAAERLRVICTASTGTNHIDKVWAKSRGIPILSLTDEREVINRISSTAELAFGLTLAGLRHIVRSHAAAAGGEWDYTKYIGRQMDGLTIGVVGYGRLGSMYAGYCRAFGSRVLVFDPYKTVVDSALQQVTHLHELLAVADVVSLHVHVSAETTRMIDASCFSAMKPEVLLVNTSRGEVVDEPAAAAFLRTHPAAMLATDVLSNEQTDRTSSPLLRLASEGGQVILTPHIGGMTREAQEMAYCHAAGQLQRFLEASCG